MTTKKNTRAKMVPWNELSPEMQHHYQHNFGHPSNRIPIAEIKKHPGRYTFAVDGTAIGDRDLLKGLFRI